MNNLAKEARRLKFKSANLKIEFEECCLKIEFEEKRALFGVGREALKSEIFIWKGILARASTLGVFFSWYASGPGIPPTLDLEEGGAFYDM